MVIGTHVSGSPVDRAQILRSAAAVGIMSADGNTTPRIMASLCDPAVSAAHVCGLISKEPILYARVLRVANSAYYQQSRSITTLDRALVLLGLDAVRGIAAAACLNRTVARSKQHQLVDMGSVLDHSISAAAAAESLARIDHPRLAPEAFIAGLLHNLGIAVQMHLDASGVQAMLDRRVAADRR